MTLWGRAVICFASVFVVAILSSCLGLGTVQNEDPQEMVESLAPSNLVHPRADWATKAATCESPSQTPASVTIHHTGFNRHPNDVPEAIRDVQWYHMLFKNQCDIPFHFIIDPNGEIWQGRDERTQGEATKDFNDGAVAIAFLGNYVREEPSQKQAWALAALLAWLRDSYGITLGGQQVKCHSDLEAATCPGDPVSRHLWEYLELANSIEPGQAENLVSESSLGDLAVLYISREPRFAKYHVSYQPGGYNPKISVEESAGSHWPEWGDPVAFTARVRNQSNETSSPFGYRFLIDDEPMASGASGPMAAREVRDFSFSWPWQNGDHTIRFEITGQKGPALYDGHPFNNFRQQRTNALLFTFYVWQNTSDWMDENLNFLGTYSFDDWVFAQLEDINRLFELSVTDWQPQGVRLRVAVDRIVRVDAQTVSQSGTHEPEPCPTDGCWGFTGDEAGINYLNAQRFTLDQGLRHELLHQLGLIDLYRMDVGGKSCRVTWRGIETFSDSDAGNQLGRLFDGDQDSLIATYQSRPVWFALRFTEPRQINRIRLRFADGMTHSYELWAGSDLEEVKQGLSPSLRILGPMTDTGTGWADESFYASPASVWLLRVERKDFDRMSHVKELELFEKGQRIDVNSLPLPLEAAGTEWMPFEQDDLIRRNSMAGDVMAGGSYVLSEYHIWALNRDADFNGLSLPKRRGYYGEYLADMPQESTLWIQREGQGLSQARVDIFQMQDSVIPNVPKYSGFADLSGRFPIPSFTTSEYARMFNRLYPLYSSNPFSTIYSPAPHVVGTNGVLVVRIIAADGKQSFHFLDVPQFNLQYAQGHVSNAEFILDTTKTDGLDILP